MMGKGREGVRLETHGWKTTTQWDPLPLPLAALLHSSACWNAEAVTGAAEMDESHVSAQRGVCVLYESTTSMYDTELGRRPAVAACAYMYRPVGCAPV